jgi:hypothetical protein
MVASYRLLSVSVLVAQVWENSSHSTLLALLFSIVLTGWNLRSHRQQRLLNEQKLAKTKAEEEAKEKRSF